jgi:tetratricopeptide (TPR) repeat protein
MQSRRVSHWLALASVTLPLGAEPVTFNKHIAPLMLHHCSPCHRPGEAAPFSLLTYADVRKHAAQIVSVTERRYMPPWPPEAGYGDFAGVRRLNADQLRLIADWVKQGSIEGDAADLPAAPQFTEGWQIGPPDLVVQMPKPYRLAAGGGDVFRNFVIPVNLNEVKYVRAIELRPGNKRVVHHANIWIDRRQSLRRRDGEGGQPGFPGMESESTEARSDSFDPDSHFLFWKPGSVIEPEPEGLNWRLDPGTDLILNLHLQPSGKEETVQPVVGFYFSTQPPRLHPMLLQLENDGAIDIPPGSREFAVTDHVTLPISVEVLAIYPHAHYLGKQVEAWATLPEGTRTRLIKIADWDINWQAVYNYHEPVLLPKGTTVEMRITYDNTESNPRNPNHPAKRVRTGPRSEDEMGHVWLQVLPKKESEEDPRVDLQEAVMQRRLEKYPGDFVANCNLGALYATRGKFHEAVSHFEQALRAQPGSATARNGLGAGLLAEGRVDDAIRELRETLRVDPAHLNARWNLSKALVRKGDLSGAGVELDAILRQKSNDADAQYGLAMVYFMQQRYDDALPHFQEAVRLRPENADIRTNLGALLASRGDLPGAIQSFEETLKINPNDKVAQDYLTRARALLANQH